MLIRFFCFYSAFAIYVFLSVVGLTRLGLGQEAKPSIDVDRTKESEARELFRARIAPILVERCQSCHGTKKEGGYSVATPAQLFIAGDSDSSPVVGKELSRSELWLRLVSQDEAERMPLDTAPLTAAQLADFRFWIEAGAPVDSSDKQRSMSAIAVSRSVVAPEHYPRPVAINALAMSNTAETIWVGGYAEVINWKVTTGDLLTRLPVTGSHVAALALVPDGSSLVVSSGFPGQRGVVERIGLRDLASRRSALDATADIAGDLAVSHDGIRVAIGGHDGGLRVSGLLSDGQFGQTLSMTPHADAILALAWSADGKHLVTASRDRTVKLFDAATIDLVASYDRHERAVGGVAFLESRPLSLDETGRLRLMAGDDSDGVVAEQTGLPRVLQRFVSVGDRIYIADRNQLREFRIQSKSLEDGKDDEGKAKTKKVTKFVEGNVYALNPWDWITSVAVSDSALAVGTQQGIVTVWDRNTNQRKGSILAKP